MYNNKLWVRCLKRIHGEKWQVLEWSCILHTVHCTLCTVYTRAEVDVRRCVTSREEMVPSSVSCFVFWMTIVSRLVLSRHFVLVHSHQPINPFYWMQIITSTL